MARERQGGAQFVMLTLTSQERRSDAEMRAALARFLDWGRKYLTPWFTWYIWVAEDQARGVLHFHVLLDRRVPKALMMRMRRQWCETSGMGPGAFDIKAMRSGKGTAKYLAKYVAKAPPTTTISLDGDGRLRFTPWRRSRHTGEPYVRSRFRGNPYGMSHAARWGTLPVVEFWASAGAFAGLDSWHGVSVFYDSPELAEWHLAALLSAEKPPPPGRVDGNAYQPG